MSLFPLRRHPPGTAPGTLTVPTAETLPARVTHIVYDPQRLEEAEWPAGEVPEQLPAPVPTSWVHVQGTPTPALLQTLGERYGLHPLTLEDVQHTGQRPKVELYGDVLFVVAAVPVLRDDALTLEQVSLFLREGLVVSVHEGPEDLFTPIRTRLRTHAGRVRDTGADYLLYRLLDAVIDHAFPVLEEYAASLDEQETVLLDEEVNPQALPRIHATKRDLLLLRRYLWPHRDLVQALLHEETPLIGAGTRVYLRDCHDHAVEVVELVDSYRELSTSLLDAYLNITSNRLNDIMRVLTVIATIFMPLSFLVGVYGMNFTHPTSPWAMPELHAYYGYPVLWGVMLVICAGMLLYFRRKRWL